MKSIFPASLIAVVCASTLSGCGGGGGGSSTTVARPSAISTAGTISGLGSVVVNGVRYETIGASVRDADDNVGITAPLGLGMTVSIDTSPMNTTIAGAIHVQSGIGGPVSMVGATKIFSVAGLPVTTDTSTLFVNSTGMAASFTDLRINQNVEVYGLPQSDGTFKATRIEIQATAHPIQLVGVVSNLNTANKTFTLGSGNSTVTVTYSSVTAPAGLANGSVVSVHTSTTIGAVNYAATSLYIRSADVAAFNQYATNYAGTSGVSDEVNELYGSVSGKSNTGSGCAFAVQGVSTVVSSATLCSAIQNGDYVEVKGVFSNGSISAHRIEFKTVGGDRDLTAVGYSDDANDSNHDGLRYSRLTSTTSTSSSPYEIYGTLSNCSATSCTLTSNGVVYTADLSSAVWEHTIVTSGVVEAKGYMTASNSFKVTKIEAKQ